MPTPITWVCQINHVFLLRRLARESRSFFYPLKSLLMSQKKVFLCHLVFDFLNEWLARDE